MPLQVQIFAAERGYTCKQLRFVCMQINVLLATVKAVWDNLWECGPEIFGMLTRLRECFENQFPDYNN